MKRVFGLVLAFGAASCSVALNLDAARASSPAKKAGLPPLQINYRDLAPADEYFGPLKLSILGIKNTTADAGKRYFFGIKDADSTVSTAGFIDAALHDWAHKYPKDLEVARALYFLQRLYAMVDSSAAQTGAQREATWMFSNYGKTPQAKQLRRVLASGPQKPVIAPSPLATPVATPIAEPTPGPVELTPAPPSDLHPDSTDRAPERLLTPAPVGSPEPMKTTEAAPIETSPSDGFPAHSPTPIPDVSFSPAPAETALPTAIPTLPPTPSPRRGSNSSSRTAPTATPAPTDTPFPYAQPLQAETPYPSMQQGAPTPFPTPIEPSAADVDGTARPSPTPIP